MEIMYSHRAEQISLAHVETKTTHCLVYGVLMSVGSGV